MKKKIIISVIAVAIVIALALSFYFLVFAPRNELEGYIKQNITDVGVIAQQYDKYDIIHRGETIDAPNGAVTVKLPARFEKKENASETAIFFGAENESVSVIKPYEWGDDMDLTAKASEGLYSEEGVNISIDGIVNGYKSIWGITPDSAYNTMKCAYLLEKDSYSFWNIDSQMAYITSFLMKKTIGGITSNTFIYEKDGICGFVSYSERTETEIKELTEKYGSATKYMATLEIFAENNLDKTTTILVKVDSLDDVFAIMNSAVAVK